MLFTYKTWVFVVVNLILGLHAHVPAGAELISDQQRLYKNLFNESYYSPDLVPVLNKSHIITVHFGFELVNIVQVNAKEQLIVVYGWLRQHWVNRLLTWNASDFGGIEYLHVPAKTVWIPDILLYNNIDSHQQYVDQTSAYRSDVMIYSNGTNVWRNQAILKSLCSVEVTYFPFDNQTCQLKFGSWMYDSRFIDIQPIKGQKFPTNHFQENGEWDINKVRMRRNEAHYQCCANTFIDVTVTIEMARDSMDYFINLILPCCLISSMIFLGFILPPETGERIGLSITVLLAMTVFQQLTSELMPSYDFPILAQYYFAIILEIGASVLVTTMILNFYHRTNRKMPWWMRRLVIEWIAAIVFLKDTPEKRKINRRKSSRKSRRHRRDKCSSVKISKESKDGDQHNQGFSVTFSDTVYCGSQSSEPINMELNNLGHQNAYLPHQSSTDQATDEARPYTDDGENPSEDELAIRHWEWTLVARILDRFFLVVAIICGIVTVSAIFLRAPKLWTNTTKLTLDNPQDIVEE